MQSQPLPVTPREIADARSVIANADIAALLPATIRARLFDIAARRLRPAFRPKTTRGDA